MCKVGDKVRVVRAYVEPVLVVGDVYTIIRVSGRLIYIGTKDSNGRNCDGWWSPSSNEGSNFEVVTEPVILAKETYKSLYAEAKKLGIPKRSLMNKEALKKAIINYVPPVPPKLPLGEELRKRVGENQSNSHFAYKLVNGDEEYRINAPCYAHMNHSPIGKSVAEFVVDVGSHHFHHGNKELYEQFLHYMFNDSVWKDCFITKDVKQALTKGVYFNTKLSNSKVICAATAMRNGSEFANRLPTFKKIIDLGFKPTTAHIIAAVTLDCVFNGASGGHDVFYNNQTADDFFKFFKEGFHRAEAEGTPMIEKCGGYTIWKSIARTTLDYKDEKSIYSVLKDILYVKDTGYQGWGKKVGVLEGDALKEAATKVEKLIYG